MTSCNQDTRLAIIGLGYVGLPLAVEFGKKRSIVGFDINERRVEELRSGQDHTLEVSSAELAEAGIAGSIGTVGDALDNALCESTIGLFKTEAIDLSGPSWRDRRAVEWQVARWVRWYNTTRLHSSITNLPPI